MWDLIDSELGRIVSAHFPREEDSKLMTLHTVQNQVSEKGKMKAKYVGELTALERESVPEVSSLSILQV